MAKIKLNGDTSGYIEISAPAVSGNNTLELGPGTKILTNLDNTFTGVSTFSSDVYLGNDIYLTDGSSGYEKVEVWPNDIRVEHKHIHSEFGVWTRSTNVTDRRLGIEGSGNDLLLYANSAEKVRIASNGKVGINTVSPRAVLDIEGNAENFTLFLHSNDANANLQFSDNTGGARILNYGGDLAFRTGTNAHAFGTGDSEALRITSDNKLGINITNPTRQLEIYNSSHATAALQSDTQSSLFFSDPSDTNVGQISYMHSDNYMYFRVNDAERLRIGSDGHLSYKNSSPPAWSTDSGYANSTLGSSAYFRTDTDVNSNFFALGSNAYRSSSAWQHVNSGWATQLQQSAHTGDLYYSSSSTSGSADGTITWVEHFRATSAGNFGIGQNSPADRLVVQKANASGDVATRIKNSTTTDGSASTPTTASLYLTTSTGDFNTFYIQARRYDNDTHFGYSNPRDGGHTPNMIISNEGRITKPNQPAFSVRRNSNQGIAHNTDTKVLWNTEIFDVGGHFDNGTNSRFTAPVAGKYLFLGHLYIYNTLQVEAKIYKNGSIYKRFSGPVGSGGNDNPNGIDFLDIVDLSVNDYVEIFAYHYRNADTGSASIYGGGNKETSFVGYLLG